MADFLEEDLAELKAVEAVGVFRRTAIDVRALAGASDARKPAAPKSASSGSALFVRYAAGTLALAAGLLFAFILPHRPAPVSEGPATYAGLPTAAVPFENCLSGPGQGVSSGCLEWDQDRDGDVDLADVRQIQLAGRR